MYDLSIDIETLGINPGSVVLSIGAVAFDRSKDVIATSESLHLALNVKEQVDAGLKIDPDTLSWWINDKAKQLSILLQSTTKVVGALNQLTSFKHNFEAKHIWANSPDFDVVLIDALAKKFDFDLPWFYTANRCLRTIIDIAGLDKRAETKTLFEQCPFGNAHDARADAWVQARLIQKSLRKLGK